MVPTSNNEQYTAVLSKSLELYSLESMKPGLCCVFFDKNAHFWLQNVLYVLRHLEILGEGDLFGMSFICLYGLSFIVWGCGRVFSAFAGGVF